MLYTSRYVDVQSMTIVCISILSVHLYITSNFDLRVYVVLVIHHYYKKHMRGLKIAIGDDIQL